MAHVLDFLRAFALAHGLGEHIDCAEAFFEALQRQTGEHESVDVLGKLGPTATLLWTSAHKLNGVPVAHWARRRRVRSQNTCSPVGSRSKPACKSFASTARAHTAGRFFMHCPSA